MQNQSINDNHETVPLQASPLVTRILLSAPVITPLPPSQVNTLSLCGIGLDQKSHQSLPSRSVVVPPFKRGIPGCGGVVVNVVVNN